MTPVELAEKYSVQTLPDAEKNNGASSNFFWFDQMRGEILSAWGTRACERELRAWDRNPRNWIWQGARSGQIKKVAATPWSITGKQRSSYFQQVLRQADFGRGWNSLIDKGLRDYFRQNNGWYMEVIAPGNPKKPPTGAITGLAHLDSLRCFPTGDPEFPVVYYNTKGTLHLMHRTRVVHLVDTPDGDDSQPGYGESALYRGISIASQQLHMSRFIESKFDGKPEPGYVFWNGLSTQQRLARFEKFRDEQQRDERWGNVIHFEAMDPANPISASFVSFSQAPESWSYKEYTELQVNAWALALGIDVQEIWQLTGGNIGSGQQSAVLHAKSQGKTYGDILTQLERALNDVLPENLEFKFERRDVQEAQERATTAEKWAGFTAQIKDETTAEERRRILADNVETFKDAVTDTDGQIISLTDADVQPIEAETVLDDAAPQDAITPTEATAVTLPTLTLSAPTTTAKPISPVAVVEAVAPIAAAVEKPMPSTQASPEEVLRLLNAGLITIGDAQRQLGQPIDPELADMYMIEGVPVSKDVLMRMYETRFGRGVDTFTNAVNAPPTYNEDDAKAQKDIQATRLDFEGDFGDLIKAARDGDLDRRRFGLLARDMVRKYGQAAYIDGLNTGGVETDILPEEDRADYTALLASQSAYVTGFGAELFKEGGITDTEAETRPAMWFNKSIMPFMDAGRLSADSNGVYQWYLGDTEHCGDCLAMDGQRHRMKEYVDRGILPQSSTLKCQGFFCKCTLSRTKRRVKGNWLADA